MYAINKLPFVISMFSLLFFPITTLCKNPVLQVLGLGIEDVLDPSHKPMPFAASAFLVKTKNPTTKEVENLIISATHAVLHAHMSALADKNRLFVSPIGSGEIFNVLPKADCAVDDAVVLCLQNPEDIQKLIATTDVYEFMEEKKFYALNTQQTSETPKDIANITIFGCDSLGKAPEIFETHATWLRTETAIASKTSFHSLRTRLAMSTDKQVFCGLSGGCVLLDNKVIGLQSSAGAMVCDITPLPSILAACARHFASHQETPFFEFIHVDSDHFTDIDNRLHVPEVAAQQETHALQPLHPYKPDFCVGLSQQAKTDLITEDFAVKTSLPLLTTTSTAPSIAEQERIRLILCNEDYLFGDRWKLYAHIKWIDEYILRPTTTEGKISTNT